MNKNEIPEENKAHDANEASESDWGPKRTVLCDVFHGVQTKGHFKWDPNYMRLNHTAVLSILRSYAEQERVAQEQASKAAKEAEEDNKKSSRFGN